MRKSLSELLELNREYFEQPPCFRFDHDREHASRILREGVGALPVLAHPDVEAICVNRLSAHGERAAELLAAVLQMPEIRKIVWVGVHPKDDRDLGPAPDTVKQFMPYLERICAALLDARDLSLDECLRHVFGWAPVTVAETRSSYALNGLQSDFIRRYPVRGGEIIELFYAGFDGDTGLIAPQLRAELTCLAAWCDLIELNQRNWPAQWVMAQWRPRFDPFWVNSSRGAMEDPQTAWLWFSLAERLGFGPAQSLLKLIEAGRPRLFKAAQTGQHGPKALASSAEHEYREVLERAEWAYLLENDHEKALLQARLVIGTASLLDMRSVRPVSGAPAKTVTSSTDWLFMVFMLALICGTVYGIVAAICKTIIAAIGA